MSTDAPQLFAQQALPQPPSPGPCNTRGDYRLVMTVLPNGSEAGAHRFSVMVSPRLAPACAATLGEFRPVFTDWPAAVRSMRFELVIEFNDQDPAGRPLVQTLEPELVSRMILDSALWAALFPEQSFVQPFVFDRREFTQPQKTHPLALPERNLYRFAIKEGIFQQFAVANATTKPQRTELLPRLEQAGVIHRATVQQRPGAPGYRVQIDKPLSTVLGIRDKLMRQEINSMMQVQPRGEPAKPLREFRNTVPRMRSLDLVQAVTQNQFTDRQLEFFEYQAWSQRPELAGPPRRREPTPEERNWARTLDFHQIVSSLSDYPEMCKRLGLRLDFIFSDRAIQKPGRISIRIKDGPISAHVIAPKTEYSLTRGFRPKADENSGLQDGYLPFGSMETISARDAAGRVRSFTLPVYDVVPGDVEGSVAKIANFAEQLLSPDQAKPGSSEAIFPSLRSAGLAVAHNQRDRWLQTMLLRATEIQTGLNKQDPNLVLRHEDLIRGFRIDVREVRRLPNGGPQFGPWRSLCDRQAAYSLGTNAPPVFTASDEGWVALGVTQGQPGTPTAAPLAAQSAVPQILRLYESLFRWTGWSLCIPRIGKPISQGNAPVGPGATSLNFRVNLTPVPGTLPRLRFGRQYQFRARIVDLAGNSLPLSDPMVNLSKSAVTSDQDGYYDRFDPVRPPVTVLTAPVTGPPSPAFPQGDPIAPGESSTRLVIRTINRERQDELSAAPPNPRTARHIVPPKVSQELAESHGMFDHPQTKRIMGAEAYRLMAEKDQPLSQEESQETVRSEPFLVVPYLPDPMAAGAALFPLPGADPRSGSLWLQPFEGAWPNKQSFRLQLEGGQGAPLFQNGVLRVFLPPGEQRTIQLSSFLLMNQESQFGIWRWIEEKARDGQGAVDINSLRTLVRQGRHWMISPVQELVLVHATQQPWLTPLWLFLECARQEAGSPGQVERHRHVGETTAPLLGTVALHRPSTEKFALQAEWLEPIDQGTMQDSLSDWLYSKGSETVFEQPVAPPIDPGKAQVVSRGISDTGSDEKMMQDLPRDSYEVDRFPDDRLPGDKQVDTPDTTEPEVPDSQPPAEPQSRAVPGSPLTRPLREVPLQRTPAQVKPAPPAQTPTARPFKETPQAAPRTEAIIPSAAASKFASGLQGGPPYDESKHRCAKTPSNLAPQNYGDRIAFSGSHRFHDTKYRCVTYTITSTTRYRDYFRPLKDETTQSMPRFTRTSPPIQVDILSSAQPDAPKVLYVLPTFKWESTPQGRRRTGGGLRVYLERPWFSSGDGEQLAVVLYPDATADLPDYAIPVTTQWGLDPLWEPGPSRLPPGVIEKLEPGKVPKLEVTPERSPAPVVPSPKVPHRRLQPQFKQLMPRGIEPPDEVTSRAAPLAKPFDPSLKKQLITRFGVGLSHPTPAHFLNAVAVRHDLGIEEVRLPPSPVQSRGLESATTKLHLRDALLFAATKWSPPLPVTICAFDVKPDPARQLWYCDIEMDPGTAYFPFVRLALARYQVNSVPRAHLSPVVLADFVQLLPDRACSLARTQDPKNPNSLSISLAGSTAHVGPERTSQVEVSLEERNPNLPEDLGWAAVPNTLVALNRIDQQQWQGLIALPPAAPSKVYRVIIKEYEVFTGSEADTGRTQERRMVFADALNIPQ